jgi:hypothetical protein
MQDELVAELLEAPDARLIMARVQAILDDGAFMAFEAVGTFKLPDTLTALTIPSFSIPVKAIFDPKANREALQALVGYPPNAASHSSSLARMVAASASVLSV